MNKNSKITKLTDTVKILLFVGVMVLGFIIGLAFFARPATSESEKRELTKFPQFTISGFLSGDFTNEVSLWYSDTYPLREPMIAASNKSSDRSIKPLRSCAGSSASIASSCSE